jgi:hypothetical protein
MRLGAFFVTAIRRDLVFHRHDSPTRGRLDCGEQRR